VVLFKNKLRIMRKIVFSLLIALKFSLIFGQVSENEISKDSSTIESVKGTWNMNLDIASRYIWRGQSWGGDYPVLQLYGIIM